MSRRCLRGGSQNTGEELPPGQASDLAAWQDSLQRIRSMSPARVHFCHHTDVVHA